MVARLKELRTQKHISQQRLAIELGVTQQSINKYENQNIEPDIYLLIRMAEFFGVSVDYLIGHSDVPRKLEVLQRYSLNPEEAEHIEKYRQLTASQRESIALVIDNYLKNNI